MILVTYIRSPRREINLIDIRYTSVMMTVASPSSLIRIIRPVHNCDGKENNIFLNYFSYCYFSESDYDPPHINDTRFISSFLSRSYKSQIFSIFCRIVLKQQP